LAAPVTGIPAGRVRGVGVGAGSKEVEGRANVVRAVLLDPAPAASGGAGEGTERAMVVLACNVDDLDPRAWPSVLDDLLAAGARDAWLTPVLMKKGRPAHTLQVLVDADPAPVAAVEEELWRATPTLGIRRSTVARVELDREWRPVTVPGLGEPVRVKLGLQRGRVRTATPEYEDCAVLARRHQLPVAEVLARAAAAARDAGLVPGATVG
uniref:nickel insertion protein n=1 Tax=Ornithinicoccus halotolerans TaxID=1748220 RepID=UPI00188635B6